MLMGRLRWFLWGCGWVWGWSEGEGVRVGVVGAAGAAGGKMERRWGFDVLRAAAAAAACVL